MPFVFPKVKIHRFAAKKAVDDAKWRHVHDAADAQVAPLTVAIVQSLVDLRASASRSDIIASIPNRSVLGKLDFEAFTTSLKDALTVALSNTISAVIPGTAKLLYQMLAQGRTASEKDPSDIFGRRLGAENDPSDIFVGRFDLHNDEAVSWIDAHAGDLITGISDETQLAIQGILHRSFTDGLDVWDTASRIQNIIGLSQSDANAVYSFQQGLEDDAGSGSFPSDLVDRMTRAGMTQRELDAAQASGMNQGQIDDLVSQYSDRLIQDRSETISRTETLRASNFGQLNLWNQASNLIDTSSAKKIWIVTNDSDLCDICDGLDGEEVGLDESFSDGSDAPPEHPRCRCTIGLASAQLAAGLTLDTLGE